MLLVVRMLLVAMPGAPSSILVPVVVARPGLNISGVLRFGFFFKLDAEQLRDHTIANL